MNLRIDTPVLIICILICSGNAMPQAKKEVFSHIGRQTDQSVIVPTFQRITPVGKQVEFLGRPTAIAISPDQTHLAVLNGRGLAPIVIIDIKSAAVEQTFDPFHNSESYYSRISFNGILYSRDGKHLFASLAHRKLLVANVAEDGRISTDAVIDLPLHPGDARGPDPGGLAESSDGQLLYVIFSRYNSLGVLSWSSKKVIAEIPVGVAPNNVIVRGKIAFVSNQGGRRADAGDFTVDSGGTPVVADRRNGSSKTGTVSIVDLSANRTIHSIEVGLQPTALLLGNGELFVANTNSDTISIVNLRVKEGVYRAHTVGMRAFPGAPLGSSPNGLAFIDKDHIAVSLGTLNALAILHISPTAPGWSFEGFVPTGWYPGALAGTRNGQMIVANLDGVGSLGPDVTVSQDGPTDKADQPYTATGKFVATFAGTVSIIPHFSWHKLAFYTNEVRANNHWNFQSADSHLASAKGHASALPDSAGDLGKMSIEHVFYIIKENNTYDSILGDDPRGNGALKLAYFGREVTPNHHALAKQFVLFDNLYVVGVNSEIGHQFTDQAMAPDYVEKNLAGGRLNSDDSLAYLPSGFLWDDAIEHGLSVKVYGEYANHFDGPQGEFGKWSDWYRDALILSGKERGSLHVPIGVFTTHSDVPSLDSILDRDYPPFNLSIPDQYRTEIFLRDFRRYERDGHLPNLSIIWLPDDHNAGSAPGFPDPGAMVADNDLALGRIVDEISHSRFWPTSAIFVIEDDCQNDVDHVDGHRTVGFVISPYTRRGIVDHHFYSQIDMVRTVEDIFRLPPLHPLDFAARPMVSAFQIEPDYTPYSTRPNLVKLDRMNPSVTALQGVARLWALACAGINRSAPDLESDNFMKHAVWYTSTRFTRPFPGENKVLTPAQVREKSSKD